MLQNGHIEQETQELIRFGVINLSGLVDTNYELDLEIQFSLKSMLVTTTMKYQYLLDQQVEKILMFIFGMEHHGTVS